MIRSVFLLYIERTFVMLLAGIAGYVKKQKDANRIPKDY